MRQFSPILVVMLACFGFQSEAGASAEEDIKTISEALFDTYNARDVEGFAAHLDPEVSVFGGFGRPLHPFEKAEFKKVIEAGYTPDLEWRDLEVSVNGSSALSVGYLDGSIMFPDSSVTNGPWRISITWAQQEDTWKVSHLHASLIMSDERGAQGVISKYHQAFTDGDLETALDCLGDSYVRAGRSGPSNVPSSWGGSYLSNENLIEALTEIFNREGFKYECSVQFVNTEVDEESGVVITRETGSTSSVEDSGSWKDITNLWFVTRVAEGQWKIVGSLHHIMD